MTVRKRKLVHDGSADVPDNVVEAFVPKRLSVSEILRGRRLECDLSVDHVAEVLRIRSNVLEAIENGQFEQLPVSVYAIGFVRSYATYLGLDASALVSRFKAEVADVAQKPHLNFPLPVSESRVPTGSLMLIGGLLAAVAYAGWYYYSVRPTQTADMVPPVPARLSGSVAPDATKRNAIPTAEAPTAVAPTAAAAPKVETPATRPTPEVASLPVAVASAPATISTPVQAAAPPSVASQPAPSLAAGEGDGVPPVENRSGSPALAAQAPVIPDLAQPALDDAAKGTQSTVYGAPATESRVTIRAATESWLQVRDPQGGLLFTRVLKTGESYNVPNQLGLSMVTGNAGGIDISVDGMPIPRVGEAGRVVRNLSLDPVRLLATRPHAN